MGACMDWATRISTVALIDTVWHPTQVQWPMTAQSNTRRMNSTFVSYSRALASTTCRRLPGLLAPRARARRLSCHNWSGGQSCNPGGSLRGLAQTNWLTRAHAPGRYPPRAAPVHSFSALVPTD